MNDAARSPRGRIHWALLFAVLNACGIALILWRIEVHRAPPGEIAVERLLPSEETDPATVTEVRVEMDSPIDPETVEPDSVRLSPEVPGRTSLRGDRTLVFEPTRKLSAATLYSARLKPSLRGRRGETVKAGALGFSTSRLRVLSVTQEAALTGGACVIAFEFNSAVNPEELVKHLSARFPDGSTPELAKAGGAPGRRVSLQVGGEWWGLPKWEKVKVKIAPGLAGIEGPLGLEKPFEKELTLSMGVTVLSVDASFETGSPEIFVKTSTPVDVASARQFIEIDPPVQFALDARYHGFALTGPFECGARYRLKLKAGLPGGAAVPLAGDVVRTAWFPDRPASMEFATPGGYLSPAGLLAVPVRTTNVKKFKVAMERLYESNLVEYVLGRHEYGSRALSASLPAKEVVVAHERNREAETLLRMNELAGAGARGVFRLVLSSDDADPWDSPSAVIVVSDLGLSARVWRGRALVWASSIAGAEGLSGAKVSVWSDKRQLLGSGLTDERGIAVVPLAEAPEGESPALVTAERSGELSYLALSSAERPRGDFSADGREYLSRGYEVFATPERGAYRAGDTVHLAAFVRGVGLAAPEPMPIEVDIVKPDGRKLLTKRVTVEASGRALLDLDLPRGAPSGRWRSEWRLPGSKDSLGDAQFLVADFIPRTLSLAVSAPESRRAAGESIKVEVRAKHLFGDPASGLAAKCRARWTAEGFSPDGWRDYVFGDSRRKSAESTAELPEASLDAAGAAVFEVKPTLVETPAAIRGVIEVEVQEPGGRALAERITRSFDPHGAYLGVRLPSRYPTAGEKMEFDVAAVAPDGAPSKQAAKCAAQLRRVSYNSVLRRSGGRLSYEWTRHEDTVAQASAELADGRAHLALLPQWPGEYSLVVESEGACAVVASFYATGPGAMWASEDPESLSMELDKQSYSPGETARLTVRSPFAGRALLCVETDSVLDSRVENLPGGESVFEFSVDERWRPNVYLTAAVIRPVRAEEDWRPHRASGAALLKVGCDDRRLGIAIGAPGQVRPGAPVEISVSATSAGEAVPGAAVVLAAVDEGVLAVTAFRSPDPWEFFYAVRRLAVREFDMFSRLSPELAAWKVAKEATPGGDEGQPDTSAELARRTSPIDAKRVKAAVLYSGTLVTGPDGTARASFEVPEYVGELRIMVIAARNELLGSASKGLVVRSPLMARPSWPRFVAPGDEFDLPVTVHNRTGSAGEVEISLNIEGPLAPAGELPAKVSVADGAEETALIRLRATGIGKVTARLTARLGAESYTESVEVPVRPATPFTRKADSVIIEGGKEERITVAGGFVPGTAKTSLVVAGSPTVELAGAVGYLLEYPYGCVEQTTSRLVPLIYLRELAELSNPGALGKPELDEVMEACFLRLRMMQTYSGGLAFWPGYSEPSEWGSLYAADVLVEAKKAGREVPDALYDGLIRYLSQSIDGWASTDSKVGHAAYACYVLARAGSPQYGWMARLEEKMRDANAGAPVRLNAQARFHLAAAMIACGQKAAAMPLVADARPAVEARSTGGALDSPAREEAVMLLVLLDADPQSPQIPALAERLRGRVKIGRWGTTQENAFAILALGKLASRLGAAPVQQVTVTLLDRSERKFSSREGITLTDLPAGSDVLVRAEGEGKLYAFWSAEGLAVGDGKVPEEDQGVSVRRAFFTPDCAKAVDPASFEQGKLYQVRLKVTAPRALENLVITDLLPACLEIENPDLRGSAALQGAEQGTCLNVAHVERRDDRMLLFADASQGSGEYRYMVRAVSRGKFVLPPAEASCMYDPGIFSVSGGGTCGSR